MSSPDEARRDSWTRAKHAFRVSKSLTVPVLRNEYRSLGTHGLYYSMTADVRYTWRRLARQARYTATIADVMVEGELFNV